MGRARLRVPGSRRRCVRIDLLVSFARSRGVGARALRPLRAGGAPVSGWMSGWVALGVALAGALGSLARWMIGSLLNRGGTPWGTLAVNLTGAFAIGVVVAMLEARGLGGTRWRVVITTGFFGGFTTFSALALETVVL